MERRKEKKRMQNMRGGEQRKGKVRTEEYKERIQEHKYVEKRRWERS